MKKKLFVLDFVMTLSMLSVITVTAQNTIEFTPITVADFFDWGDTGVEVFKFLGDVEGLDCEPVQDEISGKTIQCVAEGLEDETTVYTFFLTDDEKLYLVEGSIHYLGDKITLRELFDSVAENFSNVKMKPYNQGYFYDYYAADADIIACGLVQGNAYICITGHEETDEFYPYVSLIYAAIDYVERLDAE